MLNASPAQSNRILTFIIATPRQIQLKASSHRIKLDSRENPFRVRRESIRESTQKRKKVRRQNFRFAVERARSSFEIEIRMKVKQEKKSK